ncbi:MAG: phosphate signaling complex protein PhoU [Chloroflexi bacterium]|nr:phosphate signaling complex protein PhoU [Chloroflexota bacterium]OJV94036.1 MAG: phosphate transport system regulatory protein PhoU [Chloroflexi bacterium 54-19]
MVTNRPRFEHDLQELQGDVVNMGNLVNKALNQAINALIRRDYHLSEFVIENDKEINRQRFVIEEKALNMFATQQPVVAQDLRMVASILIISSELERMGDHARGIARINILMGDQPGMTVPDEFSKMAEINHQMLEAALNSFTKLDAGFALSTARRDDEVDILYDSVYQKLLHLMLGDSTLINCCNYLIWAAHNLERYGDRIMNICERVIFVATGQLTEIVPSRFDRKASAGPVFASARQELES